MLGSGALKIVGRDVDLHFDPRRVRVAPRVADAPRWIYLPGGGACALEDNDALDALAREGRFARFLHRLESRPAYAALALALVVAALWLLIDRGVPAAAEQVALRIPPATETSLGRHTLASLDGYWMRPSTPARAPARDPERQSSSSWRRRARPAAAPARVPLQPGHRAERLRAAGRHHRRHRPAGGTSRTATTRCWRCSRTSSATWRTGT